MLSWDCATRLTTHGRISGKVAAVVPLLLLQGEGFPLVRPRHPHVYPEGGSPWSNFNHPSFVTKPWMLRHAHPLFPFISLSDADGEAGVVSFCP